MERATWYDHKLCEEHGLKYLYIREFEHPSQCGTCAHPKCTSKQISALRWHPNCGTLLRFADRLCGRDVLVEETQMTIMKQIQQGRPTILHATMMRWIALACLKRDKKFDEKEAKRHRLKDAIEEYLHEESGNFMTAMAQGTGGAIGFNSHSSTVSKHSPEKLLIWAETFQLLAAEFGSHVLMWLLGEISTRDVARIEGCKVREVEQIRDRIKIFYTENFHDKHGTHIDLCLV